MSFVAYPAEAYAQHYGYFAAPAPPASPNDARTIMITGFPQDVKERELNNLLIFVPGYQVSFCLQSCQSKAHIAVD